MHWSKLFIPTLRENPAEAEVPSHQLLLRAGYIRQLSAGIYSYLFLAQRSLLKIINIVREEMDAIGAQEMLLPALHPAELWRESGRWDVMGDNMFRLKDRWQHDLCLGMTHEEVMTAIARGELRSYKQLPQIWYQIQTKFRDEIRPRFGVMRSREFLMKDAYSFHTDKESLDSTYQAMYQCYSRIFTRLGLEFRAVAADTGSIGGTGSHEFHVLADSGEDAIAYSPDSDYAANIELAEAVESSGERAAPGEALTKIHTPGVKTIGELCAFVKVPEARTVKAIVVDGSDGRPVLLMLRGDHELNAIKAAKLESIKKPLRFSSSEEIKTAFGAHPGSLGPLGFKGTIVADRAVAAMSDFVIGANEDDHHYTGANIGRDLPEPAIADIRNVVRGDPSPDGKGTLDICRGIEVGHIFQLRTKYSSAMNLTFLDEAGKSRLMEMGCYGIGVSRIVAAAIEQNHDERGIIFPQAMAPFDVAIVPMAMAKSAQTRQAAEHLYDALSAAGVELLLDDRDERAGIMFADMELIGIPHRIVIGERGLKDGNIEYQGRRDAKPQLIPLREAVEFMKSKVNAAR